MESKEGGFCGRVMDSWHCAGRGEGCRCLALSRFVGCLIFVVSGWGMTSSSKKSLSDAYKEMLSSLSMLPGRRKEYKLAKPAL